VLYDQINLPLCHEELPRRSSLAGSSAVLIPSRGLTYRYRIPRAYEDSVKRLICPELPDIVKAKGRLRDTDATPGSQHENEERILRVSSDIVAGEGGLTTSSIVFVRMTHRFWISQKAPTLFVSTRLIRASV
jgi:hypothetical protein